MNMTFSSPISASAALLGPVHALVRFFSPPVTQACAGAAAETRKPASSACAAVERNAQASGPARAVVRVLRVVDEHALPRSAGRMVISGRFADVCAELERLERQG